MEGTLAVISQSGQSLSFFDLKSGERTAHLTDLIAEPHELCFDRKRNLLYISHTYRHGHFWNHGDESHEISIIDCSTKSCVGTINVLPALGPHSLTLDPDRDFLYASVEHLTPETSGGLIGIDLQTRTTTKRIPSDSKPHWFVMTPNGRKAYLCNKTQHFISVLDLETETLIAKINIPTCEEPGISPDGRHAYFPTPGFTFWQNPPDARVQVIDTATDKVVTSFLTGLGAQSVHVTARNEIMVGNYRFSPNTTAEAPKPEKGRLALYDADKYELLGEVSIDLMPLTMRSSDDGRVGFVANIFSGTVTVVDLITMTVIRTLDIDLERNPAKKFHQGAHGMALIH